MALFPAKLKEFFSFEKPEPLSGEELQTIFQNRYQLFRRLLTANNNALQAMAELERMYYGNSSYRMSQINSKVTTIQINVYKMVNSLLEMAEGKYTRLEDILDEISHNLELILNEKPERQQGPFIMPLSEVSLEERELVGEKMARLGEVGRLGLPVPTGFVLTASGTRKFLHAKLIDEINRQLQIIDLENLDVLYAGCHTMQKLVCDTTIPPFLMKEINASFDRFFKKDQKISTRSSALGEDSAGVSFAGLYATVLDVGREDLPSAIREVIASKYGPRAIAYRRRRGYRHVDIEMCVGCVAMVNSAVSGVLYTRDPNATQADKGEEMRCNAVEGIGRGVVDGTRDADLYLLQHEPFSILERRLTGEHPLLNEEQLRELAAAGRKLEKHFDTPQDVEWSFDHDGHLFILQSRPLQMQEHHEPVETGGSHPAPPLYHGGITASDGACCGRIVRVDKSEQAGTFPADAILYVEYPLPEWAPLLNRAAGVFSSGGNEAGHLATVSREFRIPALFGCGNVWQKIEEEHATEEEFTLDATGRSIYPGRDETALRRPHVMPSPMTGSPVQLILSRALQLITPLNLNDPDSIRFKSPFCETLHDITRFCHEKSVLVMFDFGTSHQFPQAAAKRLTADVPLEWWVLDLADGLREGLDKETKTVSIDDVVSVPMLAIWRGIAAFPWTGPPPVSMRGLGSIIFQSTMRPELSPDVAAAKLNARNFFLISKYFCNLGVRLGYHYAMIEAWLSELRTESYLTFRFKGGAADMQRKAVRARLLADILERWDFSIELRGDALLARIKKMPIDFLEDRLMILGYLSLHARQLDMVMDRAETVEKYRQKFLQEIDEMLAKEKMKKGADNEKDSPRR